MDSSAQVYRPEGEDAPDPDAPIVRGRWARLAAALLSLVRPGLGQALQGRFLAAGLWLGLMTTGFVMGATLSSWLMWAGIVCAFLGSAVDASRVVAGHRYPSLARAMSYAGGWVVVLVVVFVSLRAWVVEVFQIPSSGMAPTLVTGDHVIVWKLSPEPRRGDVVTFSHEEIFMQRVIAQGGDVVAVKDGRASLAGQQLPTRKLSESCPTSLETDLTTCVVLEESKGKHSYRVMLPGDQTSQNVPTCPANTKAVDGGCKVAPGHLFMVGDNRHNSHDSRHFGAVPTGLVTGIVTRLWLRSDGPCDIAVR